MSEKDLILPAFAQNNIPVCFSCDANFVPYLGVCISSIIRTSSAKNNYDILILEDKIPEWNKQRVLGLVKDKPNFSIRFVNVTPFFEQASSKRFYIRDRYTLSTYARFFIPDIFQAYRKIVYLDADVLVCRDIADLYAVDLEDNMLGAALDIGVYINWFAGKAGVEKYKYAYNYFTQKAHLEDITGYFQAGVLVFNLDACRAANLLKKCLNFFNYIEKPLLVDQDVLNFVCRGKVKYFDQRWNFQWHLPVTEREALKYLPYDLFEKIQEVFEDFYIIHYCSNTRPWMAPDKQNAQLFWREAQNTVFYEELLYENINKKINEIVNKEKHRLNYQGVFDLANYTSLKYKYWLYRFKKHFHFSKAKREKYKNKYKEVKSRLQSIHSLIKEHK